MSARQYLRAKQRERLKIHQEYLVYLREYHEGWINDANDVELSRLHGDLPDLMKQAVGRYDRLLDKE